MLSGTPLCAQAVAVRGGGPEALEVMALLIAPIVGVSPDRVRLDVVGGLPSAVDSVSVAGASNGRWIATLWVGVTPARRFVRVGALRPVAVAARGLERNQEVGSEDVRIEERAVWQDFDAPTLDPTGMVTSRVLREGEELRPPSVRARLLFRGGDDVDAVLELSGVSLKVKAEALASGRLGEPVTVRLHSGKRMSGRVIGPALVTLIPGGV
jgi:flagella basal body P-ring formation protein FlgA